MQELNNLFAIAASDYQSGMAVLNHMGHIARHSLRLLRRVEWRPLATCDGKSYHMFRDGSHLSRPIRESMFVTDEDELEAGWEALVASTQPRSRRYDARPSEINSVLYTVVNGFAVCYDLWRRGSRKTPGTFLEILVGSLVQAVTPTMTRRAHVPLLEPGESVSTDIVFLEPAGGADWPYPPRSPPASVSFSLSPTSASSTRSSAREGSVRFSFASARCSGSATPAPTRFACRVRSASSSAISRLLPACTIWIRPPAIFVTMSRN